MSDRRRRQQPTKISMKKLLRSFAPTCSDVIVGCRTGSKTILKGEDCCKHLLSKAEYRWCYNLHNMLLHHTKLWLAVIQYLLFLSAAKDLGITQVVVVVLVGFFVSKTHATSLSLFVFLLFFQYFYFSFFLLFSIIISIYHSIIYVYIHSYVNLNMSIYLCLPNYLSISTHLPTYLPMTTYQLMSVYLPLPTYINIPTYLIISTHLPTYVYLPTHTNPCQPTIIDLPTSTNP